MPKINHCSEEGCPAWKNGECLLSDSCFIIDPISAAIELKKIKELDL